MSIHKVDKDEEGVSEGLIRQVIAWRRHFHRHPELSFEEHATAQFIADTLSSFEGIEISRPTPTSVVGRLTGGQPGRVLALRADIDALPVKEENEFEFASENPGVMHACGHDGHAAVLLGAARILSERREQLRGEILFLFQHAEELPPGGAQQLVDAGVLDGVDAVIGAHLFSPLETGKVAVAYGPMLAAPDTFRITVRGVSGHAAMPHQTVDPIIIGAQLVTNLQQIVSRNTDPLERLVLSVTEFHGGTAHNVIPGTAELGGTVRSFDQTLRQSVPERIRQIVKGITEAHGAEYEFQYDYGYRPVVNDESLTRVIEEAAVGLLGREAVVIQRPIMGGEDFSAYQQAAPGAFFNIGAGNAALGIVHPHHHARFTIDEDSLAIGVRLFVRIAHTFLHDAKTD
ncbi:M20 family metallopeptidase [Paenibacillus puerhi]|uniref:M20 family metallopeptidase n=1 Tax=Paenibacillus puerhi TaxID=2692622 RepID=UPI00135AEEF3|nr:M20 family metallopeptidase [Paenibacillus puerhi]